MDKEAELVKDIRGDLESIISECKHMIGCLDKITPLGGLLQNDWSLFMKLGELRLLREVKYYGLEVEEDTYWDKKE